jgi:hypothetical protein
MLGRLLIPMTRATAIPGSGRVLALIHRMQTSGVSAVTNWADLALETKKLSTIVGPPSPLLVPRKSRMLERVKLWGKRG